MKPSRLLFFSMVPVFYLPPVCYLTPDIPTGKQLSDEGNPSNKLHVHLLAYKDSGIHEHDHFLDGEF